MSRKEMSDALVDAEKDVDKVWNAVEKNAINHREFPDSLNSNRVTLN
jgi:hypothetical protein